MIFRRRLFFPALDSVLVAKTGWLSLMKSYPILSYGIGGQDEAPNEATTNAFQKVGEADD
jgi:hypothetical protein